MIVENLELHYQNIQIRPTSWGYH